MEEDVHFLPSPLQLSPYTMPLLPPSFPASASADKEPSLILYLKCLPAPLQGIPSFTASGDALYVLALTKVDPIVVS